MPTNQAWSRRKVLAILFAAGTFVLLILGAAAASVYLALTPSADTASEAAQDSPGLLTQTGPATRESGRDAIAAAPMLQASEADITAGTPSTTLGPSIQVPTPTQTGPARIPTGFPHTPEGAVGQLAAILVEVVQVMSIPHTHEVHQVWSAPGATPAPQWSMTHNVAAFLSSGRLSGQEAGARARIDVTPAAGQVKGVDGQDWVLACVLLDIEATIARSAQVAYGHCERMTWDGDRWVIAPGDPPAPAPSTWAGTDTAARAGWRTWDPVTR